MGVANPLKLVFASCLLAIGSAACESSTHARVTGTVVDARGEPIANAQVRTVGQNTHADDDGRFTLEDVEKEAKLSVSRCGYEDVSTELPDDGGPIRITMKPLITEVQVTSNLTGDDLRASIRAGSMQSDSDKDGSVRLAAVCADRLRITAKGYDPAAVEVLEGPGQRNPIEIELKAGPAETIRQMVEWESRGKFERVWAWVHPDAKNYLTKQQYVDDARYYLNTGYAFVSIDVKAVNLIRWVFPACSLDDFGPKTYVGAAALRVVYHEAQPDGGLEDRPALIHLVKTKDRLWRWFPIVGCSFQPRAG